MVCRELQIRILWSERILRGHVEKACESVAGTDPDLCGMQLVYGVDW